MNNIYLLIYGRINIHLQILIYHYNILFLYHFFFHLNIHLHILYETNKKGKEYNSSNDKLLYVGEYLNGKRNGKGEEYDFNGNIIFEGEYLNGKKWNGKGNEDKYEIKNG